MKRPAGDIGRMLKEHAAYRCLCDELEAVADRLPIAPEKQVNRVTAKFAGLAAHHAADLEALDSLMQGSDLVALWTSLRAHIVADHHASENICIDIVDALDRRDPIGCVREANAAGYMLRCFFEGYRRSMLIEELVLIGLARRRLTPSVRQALERCLAAPARSGQRPFGAQA